jgi:hypothetical protein
VIHHHSDELFPLFLGLRSTRGENERKKDKNKDVFFSPLKISGTDVWINPVMWRD